MSKPISRQLVEVVKWDIRGVIATLVALAVVVGLSWAANSNPLYIFDFGTASFGDLQPGAIHVKGALSSYPQQTEDLSFGWETTGVQEFSDKAVSNKLNMDYNGSSATSSNNFVISGLTPGNYRFHFTVGSLKNSLLTRIQIGSQAVTVASSGGWETVDITSETVDGTVKIALSSTDGSKSWGVAALQIFAESELAPLPSFDLSIIPDTHQVAAGGTVVFDIGLTPTGNYAGGADLNISGLVSGITAQFIPAAVTTLPGHSELQIATSLNTAPTTYEFLIRAVGTGGEPVTRTGAVSVTVRSLSTTPGATDGPDSPTVRDDADSDAAPSIIDLPPRTEAQVREEFKLIDKFAAEEERKLINRQEFLEIGEIGDVLAPISIMPSLPEPRTAFESILQGMVQGGIIQSTVDTAQPVLPDREEGVISRFMRTLFPPVS